MSVDNFGREKFKDVFNMYTLELAVYAIMAFSYAYYAGVVQHVYLNAAVSLLVFGFLCYSSAFSLKYTLKRLALVPQTSLSVDSSALDFSYNGNKYNFCDILPSYTLNTYQHNWHLLEIALKSGKNVKLHLPKCVAEAFEKKYMAKYSEPDEVEHLSMGLSI